MGHFGFSWVGLIWLLMLMIPNIIWAKHKPKDYDSRDENKGLVIFERIGEVLTTTILLVFSDTNIIALDWWSVWFFIALLLMILYIFCWVKYFNNPTLTNFYGSFLSIPVPLASLPCLSILLLSIYGKLIWLGCAIIIMSIGHIGIHISHYKKIKIQEEVK